MNSATTTVNCLPTEIVQSILQYLPVLELMRSRRVCSWWRNAVDSLTSRDEYWRQHCAHDHAATHEQARAKCSPSLTWRQLYQSLHLWSKVETIKEINCTEICRYPEKGGVYDINALMGAIIVQERYKILYYNLDGEITGSFDLNGEQICYTETLSLIVYIVDTETHGYNTGMRIIKKTNGQPEIDGKIVVPEVSKHFRVIGQDVYYVPRCNTHILCVSKAQNDFKVTMLETFDCEVISLGGFNGTLIVYLNNREIYHLVDDKFVNITDISLSILEITIKYNLSYYCNEILEPIHQKIGRQIYGYRFYGDIAIFECFDGVIRLYNSSEIINSPKKCCPLLEVNLGEKLNLKRNKKSSYYIRSLAGVDVIEKNNGHIIFASIHYGAFAIELTH